MNCRFISIGQFSASLPIKYALSSFSEILLSHGFEKGAPRIMSAVQARLLQRDAGGPAGLPTCAAQAWGPDSPVASTSLAGLATV